MASSSRATSVPASEYRRAPFFGEDDILMQRLSDLSGEVNDPAGGLGLLMHGEQSVEEGIMIPPESVLRMGLDRGDFPFSHVDFDSPSGSATYWEVWTDHILSSAEHCQRLANVGLYRFVVAMRKFRIDRDNASLLRLISRWSYETHTFVTLWGEFTFTLEDACELLGMAPLGNSVYPELEYDRQEEVVEKLERWYTQCYGYKGLEGKSANKSSFAQWQRYCFKDLGADSTSDKKKGIYTREKEGPALHDQDHLAAYIAALLSRFIAPGKPNECPRKCLFTLAATLSLGGRPCLGAFVVGNLYYWLDILHYDFIRSGGLFDISNYAPCWLLMAFLFERFPAYAGDVAVVNCKIGERPARIARWNGVASKKDLHLYLDHEENFCFRPYSLKRVFFTNEFFGGSEQRYIHNGNFSCKQFSTRTIGASLVVVIPYLVPYICEDGEHGFLKYNPHRCARQFGFDQVVPSLLVELGDIMSAMKKCSWLGYSRGGARERLAAFNGFTIPSSNRIGKVSSSWGLFWKRQADSFLNFVEGNGVRRDVGDALDAGMLRQMKVKPNDNWRGAKSVFEKSGKRVTGTLALGVSRVPREYVRGGKDAAERNVENFESASESRKRLRLARGGVKIQERPDALKASGRDATGSTDHGKKKQKQQVPRLALVDEEEDKEEDSQPLARRHKTVDDAPKVIGTEAVEEGVAPADMDVGAGEETVMRDVEAHLPTVDKEVVTSDSESDHLSLRGAKTGDLGSGHAVGGSKPADEAHKGAEDSESFVPNSFEEVGKAASPGVEVNQPVGAAHGGQAVVEAGDDARAGLGTDEGAALARIEKNLLESPTGQTSINSGNVVVSQGLQLALMGPVVARGAAPGVGTSGGGVSGVGVNDGGTSGAAPTDYSWLWADLCLGQEKENLLRSYARMDCAPFDSLSRLESDFMRRALIGPFAEALYEFVGLQLETITIEALERMRKILKDMSSIVDVSLLQNKVHILLSCAANTAAELKEIEIEETRARGMLSQNYAHRESIEAEISGLQQQLADCDVFEARLLVELRETEARRETAVLKTLSLLKLDINATIRDFLGLQ